MYSAHKRYREHQLCIDFTDGDVTALLKKVVADKSPGPDNIQPKELKECADQLSRPLTILFRKSLKEGKIPDVLRRSKNFENRIQNEAAEQQHCCLTRNRG